MPRCIYIEVDHWHAITFRIHVGTSSWFAVITKQRPSPNKHSNNNLTFCKGRLSASVPAVISGSSGRVIIISPSGVTYSLMLPTYGVNLSGPPCGSPAAHFAANQPFRADINEMYFLFRSAGVCTETAACMLISTEGQPPCHFDQGWAIKSSCNV